MEPMAKKSGVELKEVISKIEKSVPEMKLARGHLAKVLAEVDVQKDKAVLAAKYHCNEMRKAIIKCQERLEAEAEAEAASKKDALRDQESGICEFIEHAEATLRYSNWLVDSGGPSGVLEAMPLLRPVKKTKD